MISALIPALHLDSRLVFRKHSATKWNANEEVGKLELEAVGRRPSLYTV